MKKLIVLAVFFLTAFPKTFPQDNNKTSATRTNLSYWSISYSGGLGLSLYNDLKKYNYYPGCIVDIDLKYNLEGENHGPVISGTYMSFSLKRGHDRAVQFIGLMGGPNFSIGGRFFIETLFGNYFINYPAYNYYIIEFDNSFSDTEYDTYLSASVGVGAGMKIKLNDAVDLLLKAKIHFLFPEKKNIFIVGLNSGLVFNNKTAGLKFEKELSKKPRWSISLTGGITTPDFFTNRRFYTTLNAGIEGALRTSRKFEAYGNLNYNVIEGKYFYNDLKTRSFTDLSFGPRYFIGNDPYLAFFELGAGVYAYYSGGTDNYLSDDLYLGFNFGTGMMLKAYKNFGIVLKNKLHFIFTGERNAPGGYLTVSGGLRYEL